MDVNWKRSAVRDIIAAVETILFIESFAFLLKSETHRIGTALKAAHNVPLSSYPLGVIRGSVSNCATEQLVIYAADIDEYVVPASGAEFSHAGAECPCNVRRKG